MAAGHFTRMEKARTWRCAWPNGMLHRSVHHKYNRCNRIIIVHTMLNLNSLYANQFLGLIWGEINSLYSSGIADYIGDLWNIIDFISNTFYVTWIGLRITSWYVVQVS